MRARSRRQSPRTDLRSYEYGKPGIEGRNCFDQCGSHVAILALGGQLAVFDIESGKLEWQTKLPKDVDGYGVALLPSGDVLVVAHGDSVFPDGKPVDRGEGLYRMGESGKPERLLRGYFTDIQVGEGVIATAAPLTVYDANTFAARGVFPSDRAERYVVQANGTRLAVIDGDGINVYSL